MTTQRVSLHNVAFSYVREGKGDPVVLLHGYLFGAQWWHPQIEALRDRYDVIAVDLRGQMGSETTDARAAYDLWNQAEDIHALITQLGLSSAHVVGLSMGGMIAMRLALAHPGSVRSIVLMDTSAAGEDREKAERYEAMRGVVAAGQIDHVLPALPPIFLADDFIESHPALVREWLEALRAANHRGIVLTGEAIDERDDIRHRLSEIEVPVLVIHGTEDVPIPVAHAEELVQLLPQARLELVSGGHQSNVDRPEETSRLIRAFLDAQTDLARA